MSPAKALILTGAVLIVVGLYLNYQGKIPFLGHLPGDIHIRRENFSFHFPLGTCILVSLLTSLLLGLFRK